MRGGSAFRIISRTVAGALLFVLLALGAGLYWLGTEHALHWLAREAVTMSKGRLALDGVRGSLYDRISISRAAFKDNGTEVEARALVLAWQPRALLKREARITTLAIDELRIAAAATDPAAPPQLPATLGLPLNVTIANVHVKRMEWAPGQVVQDLHVRLHLRADAHELELVNAAAMGWSAAGILRLGTATPFVASGRLGVEGKALNEPVKVSATVGGTLAALQLQASTSARGGSAAATGLVRPFAAVPLETLTLETAGVNLAAWDKALPQTKIGGALKAGMTASGQFTGTVHLANDLPGPADTQHMPLARAAFAFTGSGSRWRFADIDLGIGKAGRVSGSGTLDAQDARFELKLVDIATAELHRRLQPLTLSGRATIDADPDAQRLVATLGGAGAQLDLSARHAQQVVTIERGKLLAEDAQLDFTGRVALAEKREFSVNAIFRGLDPSRFAEVPAARLNGRFSAQGALAPDWQAEVRLAVSDSRLRGQPFTANADFSTGVNQLFSGNAHVNLAGNRLDTTGRFGEPGDRLQWTLDAANLKAIDTALSGSVQAQGTIAGSLAAPAVEFKLTARALTAGTISARTLDAQGKVDAGGDTALAVTAKIDGISAGAAKFDALRLDAHGTRLRHEINALLRGADIDATLKGTGGLDTTWRWNGAVTTLEARGRTPFRITGPARVSAGPGVLVIDDLRLTALGGTIGPASMRLEDGRLSTRGTLTGVTAKALLAFAPLTNIDPRDFAIGGRWDLALGDTASGSAEFRREAGDLGVRTEKDLLLGLNRLILSMSARGEVLEATLDAQSDRMGTLDARIRTRIERRDGAWALTRDAPLDGSIALNMQSLAWVRALLPQLDQVGGRAAAELTIGGTAGQPLITGEASADELQMRAIGPGLNLTEGQLRARFDGRTLRVTRFYLKAGEGKIEADGIADLSDGLKSLDLTARADRARILSSPQLTVVLSGAGRAGLRDLRLALDGKFTIDEGRYDLGTGRRPALDDDVVVAGRTPAALPGAKPMRIALDMTVDLQDRFAVRGHGLDAVLGGALRLTTRADASYALGTIRTVRGDYYAFGQLLDIQRGELNFSGPPGNPGLDLRATRKIRTVEVGVEVSGSLQRPVVRLVSDPAMPDSETLGWLVLGRDPATASAAELAILQAAALTAGSRGSTPMQKKIAEGLSLDEFGVSQGGDGSTGSLALGKRITDKLTVRLEQGLGGTARGLLKIDYLLSQRWRLEGTAGAENAADVLFTLRFD